MENRKQKDQDTLKLHHSRFVHLEGNLKQALEVGRNRLLVTGVVLLLAFAAVTGRLIDLTMYGFEEGRDFAATTGTKADFARADIVDRNGIILATNLPTESLYANPRDILDADEAVDKLGRVLPELSRDELLMKLRTDSSFVWLQRNLTPQQVYEVNRLGIPGFGFRREIRRVYPHGRLASHVLGFTDVDGRGIAGVESHFDQVLKQGSAPLSLSIDVRLQSILRDELSKAVTEFTALGGSGIIMDVQTGETLAMVSLPDFTPNDPSTAIGEAGFNRATKGVYEMGSTFKLFTTAMALDSGTVTLRDGYDASHPIKIARFRISDYHAKNRWLSVPEILVHSSNIGSAKMALDVGPQVQQAYLKQLGLLRTPNIELPEVGAPLAPARWRDINTMTISYGHGIAVSPIQMTEAVAALVNGGYHRSATVLKWTRRDAHPGEQILSAQTSRQMRGLMHLVVDQGTGKKAGVPGYRIGGKTGTAEKQAGGRYNVKALISSFVGAFPIDNPRYAILVLVDEPKGTAQTHYFATGGWVAAPVVGRIVERMAPVLGIAPEPEIEKPKRSPVRLISLTKASAVIRERHVASR
ncbi:MAG: penicillin-binding protein 2 [Rhodospirillales bacterium]